MKGLINPTLTIIMVAVFLIATPVTVLSAGALDGQAYVTLLDGAG